MQTTAALTKTAFGADTATWHIDPAQSSARFAAATLWGRIPVTGRLGEVSGTLTWDGTAGRGRMTIATPGLFSGIKVRDQHLRSRSFFHVREHQELAFDATEVVTEGAHVRLRGELVVRGRRHRFECRATTEALSHDRIALETDAAFDLDALGMSRGCLAMIPASVKATVRVVLVKETA